MIEPDTIKLLRECDAGVKMGISSLGDVMGYVKNSQMKTCLSECSRTHEALDREITGHLDRFGDDGKDPNPLVKGMSWVKTNMKLAMDTSDATVADLMIDGCNMGVKSLSRYLNQYAAASEEAKDVAKRLIRSEATLAEELRGYL